MVTLLCSAFFSKKVSFKNIARNVFFFTFGRVFMFGRVCTNSNIRWCVAKFNFAHDYQSLTFVVKSCKDLWVEVKVETHLVGTHRVFLISEIFMFSRSWRTRSSSLHFWKITICQLSTLSVNCEQKRSYDRLKSASFWWWKKSSYFRTKLFFEL